MESVKKAPRYFIYFIAAFTAIGGLLFGFDTGVIAGALLYIRNSFHPDVWQQELIVSMAVLGALFGAFISGQMADLVSRRKLLSLACMCFVIGTLMSALACSINMLILGRFILGLAIGISSYTVPLFISEISPTELRGTLVLLNGIAITGGQALAFLVDYFLSSSGSWRLMFGTGLIPVFLLMIGICLSPQSPRWLYLKGYPEKAFEVLYKLRCGREIDAEMAQIQSVSTQTQHGWRELFSSSLRPILIIGLGLGILQQFVGINTVMYYGPEIFKHIGFVSNKAQILGTFGLGLLNMLVTIFTLLTIEYWGRRRLLIMGTALAAASLLGLGLIIKLSYNHNLILEWAAVSCLFCYIIGYVVSVGSLFWVLISEIFPLRIRGLGMSFVTAVQWGANFLVTSTFLTILNHFGSANTFWLYGVMSLIACVFVYYHVPETKGISLETIEQNFQSGYYRKLDNLRLKPNDLI